MILKLIVYLLAGMGAGIGTGLAGLSAAAVISPMLITFLHFDPYQAVGIALASDVLASAVSAYTYKKHGNLDVRHGVIMLFSVLAFTLVGSYIASLLPGTTMGNFSVFMTLLLGIKFIIRPVMTEKSALENKSERTKIIQSLTSVLGYELKTAVGTSVFIMAFTAFTGAASHFFIDGSLPDLGALFFCILFTFLGARVAALFANKAPSKTLNRVTGVVLSLLGLLMVGVKFLS